ncbi:MAG TPA: Swt1 family HEPN domain-containing protein, partial [Anaerolineae bacterium]|nr:Swt1 family HEPN domain-containing protein [Anaerolineae bacterium]
MSNNPNYLLLYEGLKIFRDPMLAFICEQLKNAYGDSWWEQGVARCFKGEDIDRIYVDFKKRQASLDVEHTGDELAEMLDVGRFGNIIGYKHNWNNVFRNTFGESRRSKVLGWLDEIREVRNSVAHPQTGDLRTDDVFRGLDNADRILRLIKSDAAHEIRRLKELLVSRKTSQEPLPPQFDTNTHWLEYCRNLLTTHQNWTSMPPALYLSPEQMDIAPARVVHDRKGSKEFRLQLIPEIEQRLKGLEPIAIKSVLRGILESSSSETKDLLSLVDESDHPIVLLGHPGLGKSVALERLTLKYA